MPNSKFKILNSILIFIIITGWIFSGWTLGLSFAQEATSTPETATSTVEIATSTPEIATSTSETAITIEETATSTAEIATSTPEIATSTPEIATSTPETAIAAEEAATSTPAKTATSTPAEEEKPVKKQSLLANLFGAVFDLLFGESEKANPPEAAKTEDKIFAEKVSGAVRVAAIARNSKAELWTEDTDKKEWQKIADKEMISENSPIGLDNNFILWLSPDQKAVVGLDTLSQVYFSQSIEPWGDTIIEFNSRKYVLLIQNNNLILAPQADEIYADETNENNF